MNLKKILLAVSAASVLAVGISSAAEAKIHVNGFINLGLPGVYVGPTYIDDDYYGYDEDCGWQKVKIVKWKNGNKIVKYKKQWVCG